MKKQMNYANNKNVQFVVMIEDEMSSELLSVKNMLTGEQSNMNIQDLIAKFS